MRSTMSVASGATFLKTETVPSVLCFMASIDEPSIAEKRNGTVHPQRSASRSEPMRIVRQLSAHVNTCERGASLAPRGGRWATCALRYASDDRGHTALHGGARA